MTDLTNFAEDAVANTFRGIAFSSSSFLALYTTTTDELGGGTEVVDIGYARLPVVFGAPVGGIMANTALLTFGTAIASYTVTHIAIHDALAAGNMLMQRSLSSPITVATGNSFEIAIGDLSFTSL